MHVHPTASCASIMDGLGISLCVLLPAKWLMFRTPGALYHERGGVGGAAGHAGRGLGRAPGAPGLCVCMVARGCVCVCGVRVILSTPIPAVLSSSTTTTSIQ